MKGHLNENKYAILDLLRDDVPVPKAIYLDRVRLARLVINLEAVNEKVLAIVASIRRTSGSFLHKHLTEIETELADLAWQSHSTVRLDSLLAPAFGHD